MKAVKFERYGDEDVLNVVDVAKPDPGAGQVLVAVVAAGINPGEAGIRRGQFADKWPAHFPEGQGSDFAGRVAALGSGVDGFAVGDEVIGLSDGRDAQGEYVAIAADRLVPKPADLDWNTAASLYVSPTTAEAVVRSTKPTRGETMVVAAASGSVGFLVCQLAKAQGARVIGIAGRRNAGTLDGIGVETVGYDEDVEARLRALAPDGIDAFADCFGKTYVDMAIRLGVVTDRIDTIVDFEAAARTGVPARGMSDIDDPAAVVRDIARRIAANELFLPVHAVFPLAKVRQAYRELAAGNGQGKVVLRIDPTG